MPLTCWSRCDAITACCSIRFDRKVAICMKSVTHCWLLREFPCSEDLASSRSRRTNRNPSCSTRAISSSRCLPNTERAPPHAPRPKRHVHLTHDEMNECPLPSAFQFHQTKEMRSQLN